MKTASRLRASALLVAGLCSCPGLRLAGSGEVEYPSDEAQAQAQGAAEDAAAEPADGQIPQAPEGEE